MNAKYERGASIFTCSHPTAVNFAWSSLRYAGDELLHLNIWAFERSVCHRSYGQIDSGQDACVARHLLSGQLTEGIGRGMQASLYTRALALMESERHVPY